ncbi:hypothetical protein M5D96_002171, partial [Drosophila gunungcola]
QQQPKFSGKARSQAGKFVNEVSRSSAAAAQQQRRQQKEAAPAAAHRFSQRESTRERFFSRDKRAAGERRENGECQISAAFHVESVPCTEIPIRPSIQHRSPCPSPFSLPPSLSHCLSTHCLAIKSSRKKHTQKSYESSVQLSLVIFHSPLLWATLLGPGDRKQLK